MYLAIDQLPEIVRQYYAAGVEENSRLVGLPASYAAAYFDIIRFFGPNAIDPFSIRIEYLPDTFRLKDPLIKSFTEDIRARMMSEGRLHDGPTITRLARLDTSAPAPIALVQEADYGEQAGSSFALDYPDNRFDRWGGTLRHYWKAAYPSLRLEDNPLGIALGVSAMLIAREGDQRFVLIVRRAGGLASLEKSVGPSIAGSVDFHQDFTTLGDLLLKALGEEMLEETGLTTPEATLIPLGFAREMLRGDRPQLFGLVVTSFPRYQLKRLLNRGEHGEFDSFFFARIRDGHIDDRFIASMNFEARMTYSLAEEYLSTSQQETRK